MDLLKKVILALFISISMFAIAPSVMAAEAPSTEEVAEAIEESIKLSGQTLAALKANESKDSILALFKATKTESKKIDSTPVERTRFKASQKMDKARLAFKKGNSAEAEELMTEVVELFAEVQRIHKAI
ncbi:MAG: hypothetical protein IBX55_12540 [Methyloprofundus sp.]|nr:hypothetical protein [Methyloprofundus sp.]MBW6453829.1 hypothetical protein [Methyloprofundus sp.]